MNHEEFIKWAVGLTITILGSCGAAIIVMLRVAFKLGAQAKENTSTVEKVEKASLDCARAYSGLSL